MESNRLTSSIHPNEFQKFQIHIELNGRIHFNSSAFLSKSSYITLSFFYTISFFNIKSFILKKIYKENDILTTPSNFLLY